MIQTDTKADAEVNCLNQSQQSHESSSNNLTDSTTTLESTQLVLSETQSKQTEQTPDHVQESSADQSKSSTEEKESHVEQKETADHKPVESIRPIKSVTKHDDGESDDEDEDDDVPATSTTTDAIRTGLADPTAALRALEKHTASRAALHHECIASCDHSVKPESAPVRGRRSRPDVWTCFLGCGQNYRKSSGRSIRRHVIACFREYYPSETAPLTDSQLNDLLATRQETGSIDTGLRTWRLRQQRRNAGDLPVNERWQCPNNCGRCYRATSVKSIQKHLVTCVGPASQPTLQLSMHHGTVSVGNNEYVTPMMRAVPATLLPNTMVINQSLNQSVSSPSANTQGLDWRHSLPMAQPIGMSVQQIGRTSFPMTTSSISPFMFMNQPMIYQASLDNYQLQQLQSLNQPIAQATPFIAQATLQSQDSSPQQQQQQQLVQPQQQQQFRYPQWQSGMPSIT